MSRSVSYSEINSVQTCFRRHDLQYVGHAAGSALKPRSVGRRLTEGRAFGAAVAEFHAHGAEMFAAWDAHQALTAALTEDFDQMVQAGAFVAADAVTEAQARVGAVLDHYMELAVPIQLTRLEDPFDVPIRSRSGGRSSSRYRFTGRIDGFAPDEYGHRWIVEFKLRGQLTPAWLIAMQPQTRYYGVALAHEWGEAPVGVIVEERLNEAPHPARVLKNGKPSTDRQQLTTGALYRQACAEAGADADEDLARFFDARQWQQRVPILFRPGELEEAAGELTGAARLIHQLDTGEIPPLRNVSRIHCGGCQFREICAAPRDTAYVDALFERVPAKRDRESITT